MHSCNDSKYITHMFQITMSVRRTGEVVNRDAQTHLEASVASVETDSLLLLMEKHVKVGGIQLSSVNNVWPVQIDYICSHHY